MSPTQRRYLSFVGIRRSLPGARSVPQPGRGNAGSHPDGTTQRAGAPVQGTARHGPGRAYVRRGRAQADRPACDGAADGSARVESHHGKRLGNPNLQVQF